MSQPPSTRKKRQRKLEPYEEEVNEKFLQSEIESFKLFFENFDVATKRDPKPKMKIKELGIVLRSLKFYPTQAELLDMMKEMDPEATGLLNFFPLLILIHRQMETTNENDVFQAFKVFDEDQDGVIAMEEMRRTIPKIGEKLNYLEMKEFEKQTLKYARSEEIEDAFDYDKFINKMTVDPKKKGKGKKK